MKERLSEQDPGIWNNLDAKLLKHKDQIQADLNATGLPSLKTL